MNIDTLVSSTITKASSVASLPGFGTPAFFGRFASSKTTTAFTRARYYTSTASMLSDGWTTSDSLYKAASSCLNNGAKKVLIGRIDPADANAAASGNAIMAEQPDFYSFEVVGYRTLKITLSVDLIASNAVASTINGVTVSTVTYTTSHANTMALWKTAIETAIHGATATVSGASITVVAPGIDLNVATVTITGGASQPTVAITYPLDATTVKAWMAWGETIKRIQFVQTSEADCIAAGTGVVGTAGLMEFANLSGYKRVAVAYHATNTEYLTAAWAGEQLSKDPGKYTFAFRTLSGISADSLTETQASQITAKKGNHYTTTAGVTITYPGTLADGSQINTTRELDWLNSQIQSGVYNLLLAGKLPITDDGYQLLKTALNEKFKAAEEASVLVKGSTTITVPLASSVSAADKAAGLMSGTTWSALYVVGALSVTITGTVTVSVA